MDSTHITKEDQLLVGYFGEPTLLETVRPGTFEIFAAMGVHRNVSDR
jgi:hypothetical protein